jgi:spore coat protein A
MDAMKKNKLISVLKKGQMRMSRRQILKVGAISGGALMFPLKFGVKQAEAKESPTLEHFVDQLPKPRVFQPSGTNNISDFYRVGMRQIKAKLHRDLPPTTVWGYGDREGYSSPGPTFEARKGRNTVVKWKNRLARNPAAPHYLDIDPQTLDSIHGATDNRKTVVHLHGGEIIAAVDGYPYDTKLPGADVQYDYEIVQNAATLWYHDHALGNTRLNVYMGLAGFFLVRDEQEDMLAANQMLPAPEYEYPIALQDRRFNKDGSLSYDKEFDDSFFGDVMVVNGKAWPYLDVERRKYRFRVLNGSNSRSYRLQLGDGTASFYQIGSDGGFLAAPVELKKLMLTPGERADIIVDFSQFDAGKEIVLTNSFPSRPTEHKDEDPIKDVIKFKTIGAMVTDDVSLPTLTAIAAIPVAGNTVHRNFKLDDAYDDKLGESKWEINELGFDEITEEVRPGAVEVWNFINKSDMIHPMHMHLVQFQVLSRHRIRENKEGDLVPGRNLGVSANERGPKDTVRVGPKEIVSVVARFPAEDKYNGFFPYHCHILEHEDHEMMRQYQLCKEGECYSDMH